MAAGARTAVLLERETELLALSDALARARDESGAIVVVDGPAGIGKTQLLRAAVEQAAPAGMRVLRAAGATLERELPYGCAVALLASALAELPAADQAAIPGAARALLTGGEPPPGLDPTLPLLHGLHALCVRLADDAPLLVVLDDAHDADAASLRLLAYLAARLEELPAALVVAVRSGPDPTDPAALDALRAAARRLTPQALSAAAVAACVRARRPEATDAFCDGCAHVTAGNPLYLSALLDALSADAVAADDASAQRLSRLGVESVARAVLGRIAALGPDAAALAGAVAVLGEGAPLRLAAGLAGIDPDDAPAVADRLAAADVFTPGPLPAFSHPIVREAVYEDLGPGAAGPRPPAGGEPGRPHPRRGGRAPAARRGLRRAVGDGAAARGGRRGARPRRPGPRGRAAAARAGRGPAAPGARRAAARPRRRPGARLRARRRPDAAGGLGPRARPGPAQPRRAGAGARADHAGPPDRVRRGVRPRRRRAGRRPGAGRAPADRADLGGAPGPVDAVAVAVAHRGGARRHRRTAVAGQPRLRARAGRRALRGDRAAGPPRLRRRRAAGRRDQRRPDALPGHQHADPVRAVRRGRPRLRRHHRRGERPRVGARFAIASCFRADGANRRGDPRAGRAHAEASVAASEAHGWALGLPMAIAVAIDALLELDEPDAARATLEQAPLTAGPQLPESVFFIPVLFSRGRLRIAQGDVRGGLADVLEAGRGQDAWGAPNPSVLPWRSTAAEALLALGDHEQAAELATAELALAERFAAPRTLVVARRAVALAAGGGAATIELLRAALAQVPAGRAPVERARCLVDLGAALRRAGHRRDARAPLREALDAAGAAGALALARRAEAELQATGARPRRVRLSGADALTPSERRVAELAAAGRSNPEIAQLLFVTRRTVETHLTSAYRKLDVRARDELAFALER